jgi:hypothetical protein
MLGYVRDDGTITSSLTPHLSASACSLPTGYQVKKLPHPETLPPADAAISVHERKFSYIGGTGNPGDISIWHIWVGLKA